MSSADSSGVYLRTDEGSRPGGVVCTKCAQCCVGVVDGMFNNGIRQ